MQTTLQQLLATSSVLLADGATGTNYFKMGLTSGEPPEFWITDHPERVTLLHQQFVAAGADIILTNTFGCNRHRLKLHNAQSRVHELASGAARLARAVADESARPVVVAGSVGPTGELFEPLGALTEADAMGGTPRAWAAGPVVIEARISRSGQALRESGDLFGVSPPVKAGDRALLIRIDQVVP